MGPKVSILVNCYNSGRFLKKALDSIFNQSFSDFEVIFIDNCSTDDSREIAQSYDRRLKYHKTPKNMLLYSARKYGMQFITGEYFCILDCDDWWLAHKLEIQVQNMEQKSLDFIYTHCDFKFESGSFTKRLAFFFYNLIRKFKVLFRSSGFISLEKITHNYEINLQSIMIRVSVFKGLNFNEKLNLIGDMDFFFRLFLQKKIQPYFLTSITTISRLHEGQLSRVSYRDWLKETRYIYLGYLSNLLSEKEKNNFKKTIDLYRYQYMLENGKTDKAKIIANNYKFDSLIDFYHYIKLFFGARL